jgi:hypothetical protein
LQVLHFIQRHKTDSGMSIPGARPLGGFALPGGDTASQLSHSILIPSSRVNEALTAVPGLNALVRAARSKGAPGLEWLHGWVLFGQEMGEFLLPCHHDRTEEFGAHGIRDRVVERTVVVALSGGGRSAMRVIGRAPRRFGEMAGSAIAFRSGLWHESCSPTEGEDAVVKLALIFGYFLEPEAPQWMSYAQWADTSVCSKVGLTLSQLKKINGNFDGCMVEVQSVKSKGLGIVAREDIATNVLFAYYLVRLLGTPRAGSAFQLAANEPGTKLEWGALLLRQPRRVRTIALL